MPLADQDRARIPMGTMTFARSASSVWIVGTLAALLLLCAIVGVWTIGKAIYNWFETSALDRSSVPGFATVIAVESFQPSESGFIRHYVTYRFDAVGKNGAIETFVRRGEILSTRSLGPPGNNPIRIRYSPSAPNISRIVGEDDNKFEGWLVYGLFALLTLVCIPFAGFLLVGFYRSLRMLQRAGQLRLAGVSTTGTVTDVWIEEAVSEEASNTYYMAYRFSAPTDNGDLETLQLKQRIKRRTFSQLQPGEVVTVRYEAGHPENATAEAD